MEVIEVFLRKQAMVKKWADGILGYELSSDDLWEQLKSGVDLCRLMLKIKEGYASLVAFHASPGCADVHVVGNSRLTLYTLAKRSRSLSNPLLCS